MVNYKTSMSGNQRVHWDEYRL